MLRYLGDTANKSYSKLKELNMTPFPSFLVFTTFWLGAFYAFEMWLKQLWKYKFLTP